MGTLSAYHHKKMRITLRCPTIMLHPKTEQPMPVPSTTLEVELRGSFTTKGGQEFWEITHLNPDGTRMPGLINPQHIAWTENVDERGRIVVPPAGQRVPETPPAEG